LKETQTHAQLELIPEPALCKLKASPCKVVGSGISQRAAAARTQGPWRGLVKKGIMGRRGSESIKVLISHWRWLEANGYKQQAASCKRQAASLTRKHYNDIVSHKLKEKVWK
jgi:hypothetical protein